MIKPVNTRERPRNRMISARVSPMVEMARWFFELNMIPYAEEAHVPILHVLATRWAHGGNEVPVVVTSEDVWGGARGFLFGLDAKTPPDRRLLGNTEVQRKENIGHIDHFFSLLLLQVRRCVYFHLLPHRKVLYPVATQGTPLWERSFVALLYPIWRWLMGKGLDLSPSLVEAAPSDIGEAFSYVERLLADGRRFIGGDRPGVADIVFAALVSPLILPPNFGARLPKLEGLPEPLHKLAVACRERRAGQLALEIYEGVGQSHRNISVLASMDRACDPSCSVRVFSFALQICYDAWHLVSFLVVLRFSRIGRMSGICCPATWNFSSRP